MCRKNFRGSEARSGCSRIGYNVVLKMADVGGALARATLAIR